MPIEITEFKLQYAKDFKHLNYLWLEEFFEIEPYDKIVLNNPQQHIIEQGGCILMAIENGNAVGTCALLKHTDSKYELAKLGVSPDQRGKGTGRKLVQASIDQAIKLEATTLILGTSVLLKAANALYKKFGFEPAKLDILGPLPYKRETIAMTLDLVKE